MLMSVGRREMEVVTDEVKWVAGTGVWIWYEIAMKVDMGRACMQRRSDVIVISRS